MQDLMMENGGIKINMKAIASGEDLCVIIAGGDRPHIGCVTLSVPRPSLDDPSAISATTSVLNLVGHKDDEVARYVSHEVSSRLNKNVVVACGIHVDDITAEKIRIVRELMHKLTDALVKNIEQDKAE